MRTKVSKAKLILFLLLIPFLSGYRTIPRGNQWAITASDAKLYLKFCSTLNPSENDITDSSDSLYNQTLTHDLIVASIVNNYNALTTSYVRLGDSATDSSYNSATHGERIIDICTGNTSTMAGYAQTTVNSEGNVIGCTITVGSFNSKASSLVRTITHEIGHCLGLDHPQETKYAIMSYFSENLIRLQDDDKAGLTYLYPADNAYSRRSNLGASCSPQN